YRCAVRCRLLRRRPLPGLCHDRHPRLVRRDPPADSDRNAVTSEPMPADAPSDLLKHFQLVMTHVIAHPNFGAAVKHALSSTAAADPPTDSSKRDALASFKANGIALPAGATANVSPSTSDSPDDPPLVSVCIVTPGGGLYCVDIRPPITILNDD